MKQQYEAHAGTRIAKKQHVYEGKYSLRVRMMAADDELKPEIDKCTFRSNDRAEYVKHRDECKQTACARQKDGRYRFKAASLIERLTSMAEEVLKLPVTITSVMLMTIPLMFSTSTRINEMDRANSKREDGHVNTIEDFEINGWLCTQSNGSKNAGECRPTRTKVLMLDPELTQRMLEYVFSSELVFPESFDATKFFKSPMSQKSHVDGNGKKTRTGIGSDCACSAVGKVIQVHHCNGCCDGTSVLHHVIKRYGLDECMQELDHGKLCLNTMRAAALTLLPYVHDVKKCGKGLVAPIANSTRANAGHFATSETYKEYVCNEVEEPPAKRLRLCMDGEDLAILPQK